MSRLGIVDPAFADTRPVNINMDLHQVSQLCHKDDYHFKIIADSANTASTVGFVFAHPEFFNLLPRRSYQVLMDATHCTNQHSWFLFTLYIKTKCNNWVPGAQFYTLDQKAETVADALRAIKKMCHEVTGRSWCPRYFLMDQSNAEALAVQMAFPGLAGGEQNVDILWCSVHVRRTWDRRIKLGPNTRREGYDDRGDEEAHGRWMSRKR